MMLRLLVALLVVHTAFAPSAPPSQSFVPVENFNCATQNNANCNYCGDDKTWSMTPIAPTYAVPDMNYTTLSTSPPPTSQPYSVSFQAGNLRYGATPGSLQTTFGGGPWLHHDTTKPCYWKSSTGAMTCSFRMRLLPSASSTYIGSATITSNNLVVQQTALNISAGANTLNPPAQATNANSGFSLAGTLTLTVTGLVANAATLAAGVGYSVNDRLIFAQLANPVTLQVRRAWEYPNIRADGLVDAQVSSSNPLFLFANRVSQSYERYKGGSDKSWRMALWGADSFTSTKVATDLYFTMTTCDANPPTPNGGSTPDEICLDVVPQVKKYCPPAQTSTQVSSTTNGVALSFTSVGC